MRTPSRFELLAWLLLLMGGISPHAFASTETELSRTVDSTFLVRGQVRLNLDNRYGDISVKTWSRNAVRVIVTVKVRGKDNNSALKSLDDIDFSFNQDPSLIDLKTLVGSKSPGALRRFFQDVTPFDKSKVDIDYELIVPANARLDLKNKFGDIRVGGLQQGLVAEMSYGDFHAGELPLDSRIDLAFGKGIIGSLLRGEIGLKNGNLDLRSAGELDLISNSAEIEIGQVQKLVLSSNRDEIHIGEVGSLRGTAQFSNIEIDRTLLNTDFDISLGILELNNIDSGFEEVKLGQKNSDIELRIGDLNFHLQAYLEGGKLVMPGDLSSLTVNTMDEAKNIRTVEGPIGAKNATGRFVLKGEDGSFLFFR